MTNFENISIIGTGLIGGSFALALKKQGFKGNITGIGRNEENLIRAKDRGIIDDYSTDPADGIKNADLIILSSPVGEFEKIIQNIKGRLKSGAIITDVGSVKIDVIRIIEPLIPKEVSFVGTHPIAGKECSGIDAADADLFINAKCIITPTPATNKEAMKKVIDLWKAIGAVTLIMNQEEHDLIFAAVSHLPHVIAYALINAIEDIDKDILKHGGSGLKDMTRIALSPAELWKDICSSNRENILKTLNSFSSTLFKMTKLIETSDWTGLEKEFTRAKGARHNIESN